MPNSLYRRNIRAVKSTIVPPLCYDFSASTAVGFSLLWFLHHHKSDYGRLEMAQQRMKKNVSVTGSVQLTDGIARAASQGGVSLASNQAHQGSQSNSVVGSHGNGYLQIQESERSSATSVVLERLKPYGASHGPPSKGSSKIGKANGYTGVSKHGSRAVSSDLIYFCKDIGL